MERWFWLLGGEGIGNGQWGQSQVIYCFDIHQRVLCIAKPKRHEKNENL